VLYENASSESSWYEGCGSRDEASGTGADQRVEVGGEYGSPGYGATVGRRAVSEWVSHR